ncbi:TPA: hypothetical protein U2I12_000711 [Citrobacter farmeri]|uniref:hypothetical protein n=1 Tax=Citrobacter farmeri TaxID=67824 RepID=UPI000F65CE1C|nr:hypothetical protein [Citrobacter farmeri]RSB18601.1 hypothetical protein EGK65_02545 [Citrobacter farmeri]HEM6628069.1 hypothetical protein [Citrobacter farmeri]
MSFKDELDQYYTNEEYAKYCYEKAQNFISGYYYMEPCVGTGSFYKLFSKDRRYGYDIDPVYRDRNVIHRDFLKILGRKTGKSTVVMSNPPFGKNATLAIRFFNKCASISDVNYICFIVPKTFRKVATQNKLHENFHLVLDEDSPIEAFILHGEPHHVPCVFQIWERRDNTRLKHEIKNTSEYFEFTINEKANIYIKRVGTKAGEMVQPGYEHKDPSMYFLYTPHYEVLNQVLNSEEYLNEICEIRVNTSGVYCVSKSEIVLNIEKRL